MLELAAQKARRRSLKDQLSWSEANAKAMPFHDGEFDAVVSSDSLRHWEDPLRVLDEIVRVLRPHGTCIIHDLKRPDGWLPRFAATLIGLTIPRDFCIHYKNSIRSAYTAEELQGILQRFLLRNWRIREDLLDVTIVRRRDALFGGIADSTLRGKHGIRKAAAGCTGQSLCLGPKCRGPIYEEAVKCPELEVWRGRRSALTSCQVSRDMGKAVFYTWHRLSYESWR